MTEKQDRKPWKAGDKAFIVEGDLRICEVNVVRIRGNRCLVSWDSGKGINLPAKRLFPTEDAAVNSRPELAAMYRKGWGYSERYNAQLM